MTDLNALDRLERLLDQWERNPPELRADARKDLVAFVRRTVLDAARCCALRAQPEDKSMSTRNEARKCADAVRFYLLCGPDESVCLHCDGEGVVVRDTGGTTPWGESVELPEKCLRCDGKGVVKLKGESSRETAAE